MNTKQKTLVIAILMGVNAMGAASAQTAASVPTSVPLTSIKAVAPQDRTATVTNIDFKRDRDGGGQLIVEFDRPLAVADIKRDEKGNVFINMGNAQIPLSLERTMMVSDFSTPVQKIQPKNLGTDSSGVAQSIIQLQMLGETKLPTLYQVGTKYFVDIPPKTSDTLLAGATIAAMEQQTAKSGLASSKLQGENAFAGYVTDTRAPGYVPTAPYANRVYSVPTSLDRSRPKASSPVYSGKPVTFNFQDVPVRTVLQLIAEEAKINIVAADSVDGTVTLKLDAVPWDQALDTVLRAKSLDKRRQGSVLWVAPQKEIAAYEQAKEDARIALDNRADLTTEYIQINYHNAEAIYKALTEAKGVGGGGGGAGGAGGTSEAQASETGFLSPRGRLVVDQRTNTLMISDIPRKIQQLKELVSVIDRPVDQVLIEARVVVANEKYAKELGGRLGISGVTNGGRNILGNSIETNIANGANAASGGPYSRFPNSNTNVINALGSAALSFLRGGINLDLELTAMQTNGQGEVVSNPRLVTTNQREAVISQGKEVGFVTVSNSQGSVPTPNVQFKEVLLELKVTPTITNDGRVFLDMNVKKDDVDRYIDTSIGQVPQISKRQINTAVLVEDGQTVVVGGVYEFADSNSVSKVPFLGDIPFLGNFFKKRGRTKEKAELLIFVTPRVLHVSQPAQSIRTLLPQYGNK